MSKSDESYPYPPELRDLFKRRQKMHYEILDENGWIAEEGDHLSETVDTDGLLEELAMDEETRDQLRTLLVDAYKYGLNEGMMKMAHLGNRVAAGDCTEVRFTDEESLNTALQETYSHSVTVHDITEHDDGTATVSLSRSWTEMGDEGVEIYELEGFATETAVPYDAGYAVDFGPRPDLHTEFINTRYAADEEDVREIQIE